MEKEGDWFGLLSEHTKRQSDFAHFQILVSFGFAGFIWSGEPPANTRWLLFCIYLVFAIYITFTIYRIQDRRLTLWRILDIKENLDSQILDKDDKWFKNETDPKKIQAIYIEKIKPSKKRVVLGLHVLADIFALLIILLSKKT